MNRLAENKKTDLIVDPGRRTLLKWMATSAAFLSNLVMKRPVHASAADGRRAQLEVALMRIIGDRGAARQIGGHYLAAYPEEADFERLAGMLIGETGKVDARALHRKILDQRMRDFAAEDTVIVGGWVLARTEARVCALIRLT